ncbi:MAG TPA: GAF domain-containing protein, partial [Polyangia bacterium]|nr:GAF domain-containing protein [Polyangia bacterium]
MDLDFRAIVEGAAATIAVLDRDGRWLYANDGLTQATGLPLAQLTGKGPGDIWAPADAAIWRQAIDRVLGSRAPTSIEYTVPTPAGPRRFAALLAPLPGDRICAVCRDVTDLRAPRMLDIAARTMSTGMVIVEAPSGAILFQNDEVQRVFGNTSHAVQGIQTYDAIVAFDREGRRLANDGWPIVRALRGETVSGEQIEVHRHDGGRRTVSINASPVLDDNRRIVAAVSTYMDVTEVRRSHLAATYLAQAGALLERFNPDQTLQDIVDLAVPALADWCYIHLKTAGDPRIVAIANADPAAVARTRSQVAAAQPLSPDTGVARVLAGGPRELIQVDDAVLQAAARDPEHLRHLRARGYTSAVVAPLAGREGVLGAITFSMTESGRRYTEADLEMLGELARRTGIALENARLFEAEQQARRQAEAARDRTRRLQMLTEALSGALDKTQVASVLVHAGRAALAAASGFVWLLRDDRLELAAQDSPGPAGELEKFTNIPITARVPVCAAVQSGRPMLFQNITEMSTQFPEAIRPNQSPYRSWAVVPLMMGDRGIGAASFSFAEARAFSDDDRELLVAITGQASLALERARLLESERQARAEAESSQLRERQLHELAARLSQARTPQEVTAASSEEILSAMGAHSAGMSLREGDEVHLLGVVGAHDPQRLARLARIPLDFASPQAEAIRRNEIVWVPNQSEIAARYPHLEASWRSRGTGSWGAVPFRFEGRTIGSLSLSFREERPLSSADRAFLLAVGELTAQALERARLYEALRQSEEQLRGALTAARAATWSIDLRTMISTRDASYQKLLGLGDGAAPGDFLAFHPDDRATVREAFERSLRDGSPFMPEARVRRGDGSYIWIRGHGRLVNGADGKPALMAGVVVDIDEQKRASVRADDERRINDTLDRLGRSFASELDHDRLVQLVTGEIRQLVGADTGVFLPAGHALPSDDGRGSWLAVPISAGNGERYGTVLLHRREPGAFTADHERLAASVAAQAAVALENARLYKTIREQKEQLEEAVQRARLADRRKDEFLAMLGHELRNPLAPIATALDLMSFKGSATLQKERDVIRRQVDHLSRLVDDLLDVSRITRGKIRLVRQVVELAAVLAKAIEMASPLLEKRRQELSVDVPRSGLPVDADPTRLAQVFHNLLTNAAKYSEPQTTITLGARVDGESIVVQVRDQGLGIAPELLPEVFDVFVQGERAMDRSQGGLGLGLAIARSLCELHRGRIEAASDGPGCGSTFTVTLPRALQPESAAGVAVGGPPVQAAGKVRVMVVDDNVDAAQTLQDLLSHVGHEAAVAHDGVGALELARSFRPEVAVLDIGLPVMDGYELARRL